MPASRGDGGYGQRARRAPGAEAGGATQKRLALVVDLSGRAASGPWPNLNRAGRCWLERSKERRAGRAHERVLRGRARAAWEKNGRGALLNGRARGRRRGRDGGRSRRGRGGGIHGQAGRDSHARTYKVHRVSYSCGVSSSSPASAPRCAVATPRFAP
ncbi:hypothetical protein ZWY2020_007675 [Hordeum vulgare]|nr:hypothetical protein ZWY2020_007675 [Hordeum vulgare]